MIDEERLRQGGVSAETLTKALQKLLKDTDSAIRDRLSDEPALEAQLREHHAAAVRAERTEGTAKGYNAFADEAITQAAVHWLLGCVFVRFLEDNGWLDERASKIAWIAGPSGRLAIAKDRRTLFLRPDPNLTDRDYLLHVFAEISKLPGVAGLFDRKHNPLYSLQPTAQGAAKIVDFFQKTDTDTNALIFDFTDQQHGTRFLGDLYQNLSESARKRYALCQTPGFVIDFILDRTLTPALDAFGLATVHMIDPACGSGHFVLAAFARIFRLWQAKEPGTNPPALVQKALDAVYGVDLNPFAIEISRFRLLIAALESSGIERLKDAPNFRFNLAAGDSLLHGSRVGGGGIERGLFKDRLQHFYETEDAEELKRILGQPYHVVVGNPPYNNVADPALREAYRQRYSTCHGKYQLSCPFLERFFDLTLRDNNDRFPAGWVGMIVSNAFMKRSFGRKLIVDYLPKKDLTHIIDTSGVYLSGFGTPTVIMIARHQMPVSGRVRAVRGKRGEAIRPADPAQSPVWLEIAAHADTPDFNGQYTSVDDVPRSSFLVFPWTISGGGAAELRRSVEASSVQTLGRLATSIGITCFTLEDDAYQLDDASALRLGLPVENIRYLIEGGMLRDWGVDFSRDIYVFPYDQNFDPIVERATSVVLRHLWRARTNLASSVMFGGKAKISTGLKWYEYGRLTTHKLKSPLSICFSALATHNHFVLDRGGKIFNRWAPVIKLSELATEESHLDLLGCLNSSVGCFWLKQVCHDKGSGGIGGGLATESWERFYEFDSTNLQEFPLPDQKPTVLANLIQSEAEMYFSLLPAKVCAVSVPTQEGLDRAKKVADAHLSRMISIQEELDWQNYELYGLIEDQLTYPPDQLPCLKLGERAFEIVMSRVGEESTWFERHRSRPITDLPESLPNDYRELIARRIAAIESNRDIALIERPEYKRRWNLPQWEELERAALNRWLLDRIEKNAIWKEQALVSCAQLRDALARDPDWLSVAELYHSGPVEDLDSFVIDLAIPEAVPFLPVLLYTKTGLRKRAEWEQVWTLQREEDAGAKVEILVPPKYTSKDFRKWTTGGFAAVWTFPRSASSFTRAFGEIRTRRPCWAGPGGPTWSRLGHWPFTISGCERKTAGNRSG